MRKRVLTMALFLLAVSPVALAQKAKGKKSVDGCMLSAQAYIGSSHWFLSEEIGRIESVEKKSVKDSLGKSYEVLKVVHPGLLRCFSNEYGGRFCSRLKIESIGITGNDAAALPEKKSDAEEASIPQVYGLWVIPQSSKDANCLLLQKKWLALF